MLKLVGREDMLLEQLVHLMVAQLRGVPVAALDEVLLGVAVVVVLIGRRGEKVIKVAHRRFVSVRDFDGFALIVIIVAVACVLARFPNDVGYAESCVRLAVVIRIHRINAVTIQ